MESIKYALWLEKSNCNDFLFKEAYHETEKKILTLFLTIAMSFSMLRLVVVILHLQKVKIQQLLQKVQIRRTRNRKQMKIRMLQNNFWLI